MYHVVQMDQSQSRIGFLARKKTSTTTEEREKEQPHNCPASLNRKWSSPALLTLPGSALLFPESPQLLGDPSGTPRNIFGNPSGNRRNIFGKSWETPQKSSFFPGNSPRTFLSPHYACRQTRCLRSSQRESCRLRPRQESILRTAQRVVRVFWACSPFQMAPNML